MCDQNYTKQQLLFEVIGGRAGGGGGACKMEGRLTDADNILNVTGNRMWTGPACRVEVAHLSVALERFLCQTGWLSIFTDLNISVLYVFAGLATDAESQRYWSQLKKIYADGEKKRNHNCLVEMQRLTGQALDFQRSWPWPVTDDSCTRGLLSDYMSDYITALTCPITRRTISCMHTSMETDRHGTLLLAWTVYNSIYYKWRPKVC